MNVVVVGLGDWGQLFLQRMSVLPDIQVVALVDRSAKNLEKAQKLIGLGLITCGETIDSMDLTEVDVVFIMTSVSSHRDLAMKAIRAGCHIFVAKPFTLDVDAALEIEAAASEARVSVWVDHTFLFHKGFLKLKELIGDREVSLFQSTRAQFGKVQAGSNVYWELGYHDLYMAMDLFKVRRFDKISASGCSSFQSGFLDIGALAVSAGQSKNIFCSYNMVSTERIRKFSVVAGDMLFEMIDLGQRSQLTSARLRDHGLKHADITIQDRMDVMNEPDAISAELNLIFSSIEAGALVGNISDAIDVTRILSHEAFKL